MKTSLIYHAGQHLTGKGLRYLKTLRVRAGLQRGFFWLKPDITHRQWPRLIGYTKPFDLAANYVFIKQSGFPCHCDLTTSSQASLLPKIQDQFAEFPKLDYPERHRLFSESTCIGSRYGCLSFYLLYFHRFLDFSEGTIQRPIPAFTGFSSLQHSPSFNS